MDNASKALIMAGAILIAVALVGVGVYLYSSAASQVDNASSQLSAAEIQLKNSEFEQFEGSSVRGTEVIQLVRKVNAFNSQDIFPNDITFTLVDVPTAVSSTLTVPNLQAGNTNGIQDSHIFKITCGYDAQNYITSITIDGNPAT